MPLKPKNLRIGLRTIHLMVALVIGTYVYAPAHVTDDMRPFMMFLVIPLATATGLTLWKQAAVRSYLSRSPRRDDAVTR